MEKEEAVHLLRTDREKFSQFKRENPRLRLDLRGIDMEGADLQGMDLRRAELEGANFQGANLSKTELNNTNLRQANFRGTNLDGANFHRAELEGADLRGATLGRFDEEGLRMCLHADCLKSVHMDKKHLEEFLRALNMNADWQINYEIVPKGWTS